MLEHREGGCHCGRVRFRARVDLDLLSQCSCTVCTKKGILHLPVAPEDFELLRGKNSLTGYTLRHRRGPTHILLELRNAPVLCAAFPTRQNQGRASSPPAFSMAVTGGRPAQTDCRRRTRRRCRFERGGHTKDNSGPRSGIKRQTRASVERG